MLEHFFGKIFGLKSRQEHCIYYLDLQRELFRRRSGVLLMQTCRLFTWKGEQYMDTKFPDFLRHSGDLDASSSILRECLLHCTEPEEQSNILRLRSRNEWLRGDFFEALNNTLMALRALGIEISLSPTRRQADAMFEQVKNEVMALTWEEILLIPRTTDPKVELAVTLLNDAGKYLVGHITSTRCNLFFITGMNAYWSPSPYFFADIIGLTVYDNPVYEKS